MNPATEIVEKMIQRGIVDSRYRTVAESLIAGYIQAKGEEAVRSKFLSRYTPIPNDPSRIFGFMANDLPNKPREEERDEPETPKPEEPKRITIAEEIELEGKDFYAILEIHEQIGRACGGEPRAFRKPNDPAFEGHPSIFDALPYKEMDAETKKLYKANTFLAVLDEAKNLGTSMHEVCRRKGLRYELLIA